MSKYFKFSSNKSPLYYTCGEEMTFEIFAREDGKSISCEQIEWEISGDDGKCQKGTGSCTADKPLILSTTVDRPGFVHVICYPKNAGGDAIKDFQILDASAGADIADIKYHDEIPEDFDKYWAEIEKTVENFPIEILYSKQITEGVKDGFKVFDVRIKAPSGRPASGCITVPAAEGKYPIRLLFNGYTIGGATPNYYENAIVANFNAHGIENFPTKAQQEQYETELKEYGFSNEENKSPYTTYFRNMMIRNLIAAKYARTIPEWDNENFIACGGSQGAFQATTVAAHDEGVTFLDIDVPWFCDLNGVNKGYMKGWRPDFEQGLRYFDTVAQSSRVKCPVRIIAKLGDYTCPPSTVMALYNTFKTEKSIQFVQSARHLEWPPEAEKFLFE